MKANAQYIIREAATTLKDAKGTRWPAAELVKYLNDGQHAIVARRPDATSTTVDFPLVPGAKQALPVEAATIIDIPRNAAGRKRQITKVDMAIVDATVPAWISGPPSDEIKHFMHDIREPRMFMVYPPARSGSKVELNYAARPTPVAAPAGPTPSDVSGECAVAVEWTQALIYYVLYRAYSKDAEFGGNGGLAAAQLALFKAELGEPLQSSAVVASTS